jgi:hypothetical protein
MTQIVAYSSRYCNDGAVLRFELPMSMIMNIVLLWVFTLCHLLEAQIYKNKLAVPSSTTYVDGEKFTGDSEERAASIKHDKA